MKNSSLILLFVLFTHAAISQDLSLYEKKVYTGEDGNTLNYRLLYPENFDPAKNYPVILFLHGSGERGNDNEKQLTHGARVFLEQPARQAFPAIVVFPQCPDNSTWASAKMNRTQGGVTLDYSQEMPPSQPMLLVEGLLDSLIQKDFTDDSRIYVMGLSMGGMGTFELVARNPEKIAAAVPICGAGNPNVVDRYARNTAFWIFHGAQDRVVSPENSTIMALAIQRAGGTPALTIFSYANHNSWDPAFARPELLPWLFAQHK
jgi:predicted peptidase